jgi:hypothetical protein
VVAGERVGDGDRPRELIAVGDPQPFRHLRVGEADGHDGVEADVADHVLGAAAQRLLAGEAAGAADPLRQPARDVVRVTVDAADLLDQVDLAGDVVIAVRRDLGLEVLSLGGDGELQPAQVLLAVLTRDRHAEQALDPLAA